MEENINEGKQGYFIFSLEKDFNKVEETLLEAFGVEKQDNSGIYIVDDGYVRIEFIILISKSEDKEEKRYFENEINKMRNAVWHMKTKDNDKKLNLMKRIQISNSWIFVLINKKSEFITTKDFDDSVKFARQILQKIVVKLNGIIMPSNGECAWNEKNQVILNYKGESQMESYFPFEYEKNHEWLKNCTKNQIERRNRNMEYLFKKGIYIAELPLNRDDEETIIKEKKEIVNRAFGVMIVSLYSEAMLNTSENMSIDEARKFIKKIMNRFSVYNMKEILTEKEIKYIENDAPSEQEKIDFSWNYENLFVLEWALGFVEWDYPDHFCDVAEISQIMSRFASLDEIYENSSMRSKKEILDIADLIYRIDWSAVDARIYGLTGPCNLEHGVTQERHKTLNWLINFDETGWDDVSTPT